MLSPNYRLSVTTLEKFRRYLAESSSWDTEKALLESLTGTFTGNDKTRIGTSFHAMIETPMKSYPLHWQGSEYIVSDGIAFPKAAALIGLNYRAEHEAMFMEIPVGKMYCAGLANVYLSGRIDGMEGLALRDAKTKFRNHGGGHDSLKDYLDSLQWRSYLDMTGAKRFYFDLFEVRGFDGGLAPVKVQITQGDWQDISFLHGITITAHASIECYSYTGMTQDIESMAHEFLKWIEYRDLWHLLKPCDDRGFKLIQEPSHA